MKTIPFDYEKAEQINNTENYEYQDNLPKKAGRPKENDEELKRTTLFLTQSELEFARNMGYETRTSMSKYIRSLIQKDMAQNSC